MGKPIEQCCRHFGIAKDAGPFAEAQIGRNDNAGSLIEFAEKMEEQGTARGAEGQVAKFIEDEQI